jgi:hypothetical protein
MKSQSSTCSAVSAASALDSNEPDLFAQLPSVNENPSPKPSSESTGPTRPSMTTSEQSQQMNLGESTSSAEGFPASRGPLPGSSEAQKMIVTSGRKCCELLKLYKVDGLLAKMCADLLTRNWASDAAFLTWKASDINASLLFCLHVQQERRTDEIGSGLWQTPDVSVAEHPGRVRHIKGNQLGLGQQVNNRRLWPAPTTRDRNETLEQVQERKEKFQRGESNFNPGLALCVAVKLWPTPTTPSGGGERSKDRAGSGNLHWMARAGKLWPTPTTRDYKGANSAEHLAKARGHHDQPPNAVKMAGHSGGQLNPTWVEWLMGFPTGWTDLKPSEMPSSRKSSSKSDAQS